MTVMPASTFFQARGGRLSAWIGLGAAVAALAVAGQARAFVTVFGTGPAAECSKAARAGASEPGAESYCTLALQSEALDTFDRAATFVNRGVMRLRRGDFETARIDFNAAMSLSPTLGEAYVNRGAVMIATHHYRDGLDDTNRALQLGVSEPEKAYFNRAVAYEGLDNMKAAYFDYLKALELRPDWADPKRELTRFNVTPAHAQLVER